MIVGTQVPQLGNSNFHYEDSEYFVIEACEYKRSFLQYHPYITVITNIDLDHLDYYTSLEDYISAFQSLVDQTRGYVIISADDESSQKLVIPEEKKIIVGKIPLDKGGSHEVIGRSSSEDSIQNPPNPFSQGGNPVITYFPRVEEMKDDVKEVYYTEKEMLIPDMSLQVP